MRPVACITDYYIAGENETEQVLITTKENAGKFTTVDQLYITYKDEKILKLEEFKIKYYPVYEKIMQLLLEEPELLERPLNEKLSDELWQKINMK